MKRVPILIHALSPLHAGTGQGAGVIDLPIARLVASGIPYVPGSSLKGVMRADARSRMAGTPDEGKYEATFGPEKSGNPSDHAGAIVVGDARLLALPVRSFWGAFALVTSPLLLTLAARDLGAASPAAIPAVPNDHCLATGNDHANVRAVLNNDTVYLNDIDLPVSPNHADLVRAWAVWVGESVGGTEEEKGMLRRRFIVVPDDTMAFLWETATQVDARNSIDLKTGVVEEGQLWWEESLPSETLLIGQLGAESSRKQLVSMTPDRVLATALPPDGVLQVGGKATIGRGLVRLSRIKETQP